LLETKNADESAAGISGESTTMIPLHVTRIRAGCRGGQPVNASGETLASGGLRKLGLHERRNDDMRQTVALLLAAPNESSYGRAPSGSKMIRKREPVARSHPSLPHPR
jgi:hypothetical protein